MKSKDLPKSPDYFFDGAIYIVQGKQYLLSQVSSYKFLLISLEDGNRFADPPVTANKMILLLKKYKAWRVK